MSTIAKGKVLAKHPDWVQGKSGAIYSPIYDNECVRKGWQIQAESWEGAVLLLEEENVKIEPTFTDWWESDDAPSVEGLQSLLGDKYNLSSHMCIKNWLETAWNAAKGLTP